MHSPLVLGGAIKTQAWPLALAAIDASVGEERQVQRRQFGAAVEERTAHVGEVREGRQVQRRQPGAAVEERIAHVGEVRKGREVKG